MLNWEPMEKDRILFGVVGLGIQEDTVLQIERTETATYIKLAMLGWMDRDKIQLIKLFT